MLRVLWLAKIYIDITSQWVQQPVDMDVYNIIDWLSISSHYYK